MKYEMSFKHWSINAFIDNSRKLSIALFSPHYNAERGNVVMPFYR